MDLEAYEQLLARLYTEQHFRKKFFEDKESLLKEFKLGQYESSKFFQLKQEEVDFFAKGLINKRYGVVKNILPLISAVLQEKMRVLFFSYAQNKPISGFQNKHYNDAIDFSSYLLENRSISEITPPWMKDLIRYERLMAKSNNIYNRILFRYFAYPVYRLDKDTLNSFTSKRKRTFFLLIRLTKTSKLRMFIF